MLKDLADWATLMSSHRLSAQRLSSDSVKCMRGAFVALDQARLVPMRPPRSSH
jgi:hypothetical protein